MQEILDCKKVPQSWIPSLTPTASRGGMPSLLRFISVLPTVSREGAAFRGPVGDRNASLGFNALLALRRNVR